MTDEQLIAHWIESQDVQFLDELVGRHLDRVRNMVFSMVLDATVADEITQEVFVRVVGGLKNFGRQSTFSTWLYRITMNTVYSHFRRNRHAVVPLDDSATDRALHDRGTPDRAALKNERDREIRRAVAQLPPTLRAAITLVVFEGLDIAEAAKIENCAQATMYWRLHRARQALKKKLQRFFVS